MQLNEVEARALVELFSVLNDVCTEPDVFADDKLRVGLGRCYRAWRCARDVLARQSYTPLQSRIPERSERESTIEQ